MGGTKHHMVAIALGAYALSTLAGCAFWSESGVGRRAHPSPDNDALERTPVGISTVTAGLEGAPRVILCKPVFAAPGPAGVVLSGSRPVAVFVVDSPAELEGRAQRVFAASLASSGVAVEVHDQDCQLAIDEGSRVPVMRTTIVRFERMRYGHLSGGVEAIAIGLEVELYAASGRVVERGRYAGAARDAAAATPQGHYPVLHAALGRVMSDVVTGRVGAALEEQ